MHRVALLLTLHFGGPPGSGDRWFSADKTKHFLTSAFVQSVSFSALRTTGIARSTSLLGATAVAGTVGVGKELYDKRFGGDPSLKDLVWDAGGIATVSFLLVRTQR
jgi:uncharacterized protein YfiM (DUF2279 family)